MVSNTTRRDHDFVGYREENYEHPPDIGLDNTHIGLDNTPRRNYNLHALGYWTKEHGVHGGCKILRGQIPLIANVFVHVS